MMDEAAPRKSPRADLRVVRKPRVLESVIVTLDDLALTDGRRETLPAPPARDLLRGCCLRGDEATSSIGFLNAGIMNW